MYSVGYGFDSCKWLKLTCLAMGESAVKIVAKKTMREISALIREKGLRKEDIIQIIFGDGNWYLIYQD